MGYGRIGKWLIKYFNSLKYAIQQKFTQTNINTNESNIDNNRPCI